LGIPAIKMADGPDRTIGHRLLYQEDLHHEIPGLLRL
jgi:hypothetical protein